MSKNNEVALSILDDAQDRANALALAIEGVCNNSGKGASINHAKANALKFLAFETSDYLAALHDHILAAEQAEHIAA